MDAKEFIDMCKAVSVLPNGVAHIKQNVPDELKVTADGIVYYPVARIAQFDDDGKLTLYAKLHCLKANSATICPLEKVSKFKEDE